MTEDDLGTRRQMPMLFTNELIHWEHRHLRPSWPAPARTRTDPRLPRRRKGDIRVASVRLANGSSRRKEALIAFPQRSNQHPHPDSGASLPRLLPIWMGLGVTPRRHARRARSPDRPTLPRRRKGDIRVASVRDWATGMSPFRFYGPAGRGDWELDAEC